MSDFPRPNEHVLAHKRGSMGRVTVHAWRAQQYNADDYGNLTDCRRRIEKNYSWLWVEFRTLNPVAVVLCKRCWKPDVG